MDDPDQRRWVALMGVLTFQKTQLDKPVHILLNFF